MPRKYTRRKPKIWRATFIGEKGRPATAAEVDGILYEKGRPVTVFQATRERLEKLDHLLFEFEEV